MNDSAGWVMPGGSPHPLHTCLISVHSCQSLLAMRRMRSTTTVLYRRMCRLSPRQTPTVPPGGRVGMYDSCPSPPPAMVTSFLRPRTTAIPSGIRTERVGADFSDWLSLPEDAHEPPHPKYEYTGARSTSSRPVIATAHTICSYDQLADIARLLDRQSDAERFTARAADIRLAYAKNFLDASGRIESDTQTVYAQAVGYEILRGSARAKAVARLAEKVRALGHLTTGIHGVDHIIPVLARNGHLDVAESLLFRQDMPSWNHMVRMGATTVWEKWDGISADGSMSTAEMNSFNHCALGAVGEFLFEGVAGLNARAVATAQTVVIAPVYLDQLDWARANYHSVGGTVLSSWERTEGMIRHSIHLAPGLRADYQIMPGYRIIGSDSDSLSLDSGHSEVLLERVG